MGLPAGAYSVTEAPLPTGWQLASASCNGGNSSFVGGNTILLNVAAGANVTCTFVNIQTAAGAVSPIVVIPTPEIVLPVPSVLVPGNTNVAGSVPTTTNTNVGSNVPTTTSPVTSPVETVAGVRAPGPNAPTNGPIEAVAGVAAPRVGGGIFATPGVPSTGNTAGRDNSADLAIGGGIAVAAGSLLLAASSLKRRRS
jgi:hypothetical protein